ncbi:MAG: YceI family protein [bacterium]
MINVSIRFLSVLILLFSCFNGFSVEKEKETYHILQKGYIRIEGSTNLFNFTGKSLRHSGSLEEGEAGTYSGVIVLRFDQISFPLPGVESVLKDPTYIDSDTYPTIEIRLDRFNPHEKPSTVEGMLDLHAVKRKVQIAIDLVDISPIVKAEGSFTIRQTDFQVRPYQSAILKVDDQLKISFQLFFCEIYDRIPADDRLDDPLLQSILNEGNITFLKEPDFWGCEELKGYFGGRRPNVGSAH